MIFLEGSIVKPPRYVPAGKNYKEFSIVMIRTYNPFAKRSMITHKVLLFNTAMKRSIELFEEGQWASVGGRIDYVKAPRKKEREVVVIADFINFMSNDVVIVHERARKLVRNEEQIIESVSKQADTITEDYGECSVVYIDDDWEE